jgi:hypothetical protein
MNETGAPVTESGDPLTRAAREFQAATEALGHSLSRVQGEIGLRRGRPRELDQLNDRAALMENELAKG